MAYTTKWVDELQTNVHWRTKHTGSLVGLTMTIWKQFVLGDKLVTECGEDKLTTHHHQRQRGLWMRLNRKVRREEENLEVLDFYDRAGLGATSVRGRRRIRLASDGVDRAKQHGGASARRHRRR